MLAIELKAVNTIVIVIITIVITTAIAVKKAIKFHLEVEQLAFNLYLINLLPSNNLGLFQFQVTIYFSFNCEVLEKMNNFI